MRHSAINSKASTRQKADSRHIIDKEKLSNLAKDALLLFQQLPPEEKQKALEQIRKLVRKI